MFIFNRNLAVRWLRFCVKPQNVIGNFKKHSRLKNISFKKSLIISLISLSIILGIAPGLIYYFFIPIFLFLILLLLLWLTDLKIKFKILFTILPFLLTPSFFYFTSLLRTNSPTIINLPKNYRGKVRIVFDEKCGENEIKKDGKRIYQIPNDGILITKFAEENGILNEEFYLTDGKTKLKIERIMLQLFNGEEKFPENKNRPLRKKIGIFEGRIHLPKSYEFYVCNYDEFIDFGFNYEQNFEQKTKEKIEKIRKNCR